MNPLRWIDIQLAGLREQSQVTEQLGRLGERNLADIGLSAGDIPAVARDARRTLVARLLAEPGTARAPAHDLRYKHGLGSVR